MRVVAAQTLHLAGRRQAQGWIFIPTMEFSTHAHMAICSFLCIPLLHIPVFYAFYVEYSTHNSEKVVFSAILRYGHIFNPVITS